METLIRDKSIRLSELKWEKDYEFIIINERLNSTLVIRSSEELKTWVDNKISKFSDYMVKISRSDCGKFLTVR